MFGIKEYGDIDIIVNFVILMRISLIRYMLLVLGEMNDFIFLLCLNFNIKM